MRRRTQIREGRVSQEKQNFTRRGEEKYMRMSDQWGRLALRRILELRQGYQKPEGSATMLRLSHQECHKLKIRQRLTDFQIQCRKGSFPRTKNTSPTIIHRHEGVAVACRRPKPAVARVKPPATMGDASCWDNTVTTVAMNCNILHSTNA